MSLKKSFFCLGLALVMLSPFSSTANGNLVGEEQQKKDPQKIEKFLLDYASKKISGTNSNNISNNSAEDEKHLTAESYDFYVFLNDLFWETDQNLKNSPDYRSIMEYAYEKVTEKTRNALPIDDKMAKKNLENDAAKKDNVQPFNSYYNRQQVVNYARNWVSPGNQKRNLVEYPTFDLDCTNFASQAWVAGGNVQRKPSNIPNNYYSTSDYWYSIVKQTSPITGLPTLFGWSTSWSVVDDFQDYWRKRGQSVISASHSNLNTIISNAEIGDIVQFKSYNSPRPTHSMVVTKKENGTLYLTYHSGPNNNDVLDNDIKNIEAKETWYLVKF
ncbi:amidase domain-containing protein [Paenibacillus ehimensis]|nr:amidase domain-containing protein [Paenibacillus ehimensis]